MLNAAAPILGAKFWFEGREFVAGSDGFAVIPFMDHEKNSVVVATAPGGYASARNVNFVAESWEATVSIIAPHETFIPGCTANIVLRCGLFLSGTKRLRMPLSELQSPSVSLDARDEKGVTVQASSMKVTFNECADLVVPWTYPVGCCSLNVTLSANVSLRSSANGTHQSVRLPAFKCRLPLLHFSPILWALFKLHRPAAMSLCLTFDWEMETTAST